MTLHALMKVFCTLTVRLDGTATSETAITLRRVKFAGYKSLGSEVSVETCDTTAL